MQLYLMKNFKYQCFNLLPLKKGHLIFQKKKKIFIVHEDFNHIGNIDFNHICILFYCKYKIWQLFIWPYLKYDMYSFQPLYQVFVFFNFDTQIKFCTLKSILG